MAQDEKTIWDLVEQGLKIFGMIGGIGVGYLKFLHGRLHFVRLSCTLNLSAKECDGATYLLVSAAVKNIGLSQTKLHSGGKYLKISHFQAMPDGVAKDMIPAPHINEQTVYIFNREQSIEAGESIEEDTLIFVPPGTRLAIQVLMIIEAQKTPFLHRFRIQDGEPDYHKWGVQKIIYMESKTEV